MTPNPYQPPGDYRSAGAGAATVNRTPFVLAAVVAYSLQIYCDFSGYTDIAIGVAKMTGFDLPENFNMPYLARSITDFWRRWHITLSQWLRDYLYIPLGGNRRGTVRTYVNLMLTMLLGGLWHGASWTFVVWGLLHGIGLATHKLWSRHRPDFLARSGAVGAVVGWSLTYAFVCLAWIFFRAPNFSTAALMIRKIIGQAPGGISWFFLPFWMLLPLVAAAHVIGSIRERRAPTATEVTHDRRDGPRTSRPPFVSGTTVPGLTFGFTGAIMVTIWLVVLFLFTPLSRSPFIYFQF